MEGFSYCGRNLSEFGCYYIPDASARGDVLSDYDISDDEYGASDGGYYYSVRVKPRVFKLACYYEEITRKQKADILMWLDRRTKGQLIFDDRNYCYYDVVPSAKIEFKDYLAVDDSTQLFSGTFTVTFTAYCPFAKMLLKAIGGTTYEHVEDETGIIPASMMPPAPTTSSTSFLVYNCGTEKCGMTLKLAGDVGTGVTFSNAATGQVCKAINITAAVTTDVNKRVEIDSETSTVRHGGANMFTVDFAFHDDGYIQLAPCVPYYRNVSVSYTSGSKKITSDGAFNSGMVGQYVYLAGEWKYISKVTNANTALISTSMSASATETTMIATLNLITITGSPTWSILEIAYTPKVR